MITIPPLKTPIPSPMARPLPRPLQLDPFCVFYWDGIDRLSTVKVFDESGNNNHGAITTAAWKADGLYFDGVSDYVEVADSTSMRAVAGSSSTYSVCFWIKTTDTGGAIFAGPALFDRRNLSPNHWVLHLYLNAANAISTYIKGAGAAHELHDNLAVNDGNPHFIVVTRDTTTFVGLYIDSILRQSGSTNENPSTTDITTIGCRRTNIGSRTSFLNVTIAEAAIFSRTFGATEINNLYLLGKARLGV